MMTTLSLGSTTITYYPCLYTPSFNNSGYDISKFIIMCITILFVVVLKFLGRTKSKN